MNEERYTILIVDDEYFIAKLCERFLKHEGYKTTISDSPIRALEEKYDFVDVVISDYNMPEMNGIEFLRKMKEKQPKTMRILMSGNFEAVPKEAIDELNLCGLIKKPFAKNELVKLVEEAIKLSSQFSQ